MTKIIGLVLIAFAFAFIVFSLPALNNSLSTADDSAFGNSSEPIKNIINSYSIIIAVLPFILFGLGLMLVFKGG